MREAPGIAFEIPPVIHIPAFIAQENIEGKMLLPELGYVAFKNLLIVSICMIIPGTINCRGIFCRYFLIIICTYPGCIIFNQPGCIVTVADYNPLACPASVRRYFNTFEFTFRCYAFHLCIFIKYQVNLCKMEAEGLVTN